MNTADRSIRSIDIALRRRFDVFDCPPDVAVLERFYESGAGTNDVADLSAGFTELNLQLEASLDKHHTIGHAFFMRERMTSDNLRAVWKRKIGPLLEEYFFDQEDLAASFSLGRFWPGVADAE
jgi:5-methylcytosine-specific restriction endonuclease McrBC GTP-binding regulatory subunit McrB